MNRNIAATPKPKTGCGCKEPTGLVDKNTETKTAIERVVYGDI